MWYFPLLQLQTNKYFIRQHYLSLHYILIISSVYNIYCPLGLADAENTDVKLMRGLWRYHTSIESMYPEEVPARFRDGSISAEQVGETYIDYFMNEGAVKWQWDNYKSEKTVPHIGF